MIQILRNENLYNIFASPLSYILFLSEKESNPNLLIDSYIHLFSTHYVAGTEYYSISGTDSSSTTRTTSADTVAGSANNTNNY